MNDLDFLEMLAQEQDKQKNIHSAKRIRDIAQKYEDMCESLRGYIEWWK